ncbi:MAG: ABC transporter ATP-binding protein [Aphanocapsa lilacina HA4352-LM1]|jgi:branched-chain amino acid transport system ATP-binding protein|uniref:ABC transporter ATP-binding protein n=1 Tax=Gloeobacter morelensis MG652769 TaxID=2781736 RepID=A0ABY3PJG2_9CYAN|nr:ABC transporter ATP-binding protein [Gloeobacter morelensis]MBW4697187.1 ABC transporter ATP-binding protein [Aphanocapsa lilacina HA4352-LM1]UFP93778.1 ABC transporter ATP-binding protein [Gloeobacter morelensis MG652769]
MGTGLEVRGLTAGYGQIEVLHQVNLHVGAGELVTVIGPNGAGKSTLLRTISGLIRPTAGEVLLDNRRLDRLSADLIVRTGLMHVPEGRRIFSRLTVLENLEMGAYTRNDRIEADLEEIFHLFPILKERRYQRAGTLSGGEQQMLAIGRALLGKPRLLVLDEPSMGLAPLIVQSIFQIIERIRSQGVMVLLVEQNALQALKLADRGYVLENGRIALEGPADELLICEEVRRSYLGESMVS